MTNLKDDLVKEFVERYGLYNNYADFCPPTSDYTDWLRTALDRVEEAAILGAAIMRVASRSPKPEGENVCCEICNKGGKPFFKCACRCHV